MWWEHTGISLFILYGYESIMILLRPIVLLAALTVGVAMMVTAQVAVPGAAEESTLRPRPELLVSGQWLTDHLEDARLRIVDLRSPSEYEAGHIPNAVHLSMGALSTTVRGIPGMLPPIKRVEAALRRAGIAEDSVVVAYDAAGGLHSARLFWALERLGHKGGRVPGIPRSFPSFLSFLSDSARQFSAEFRTP